MAAYFGNAYYAGNFFAPTYFNGVGQGPVIPPAVIPAAGGGGVRRAYRQYPIDAILTQDDEEILEILMAAFASGIFNQ